jgi:adenosylcobinamide-GDP ribazoletransferase
MLAYASLFVLLPLLYFQVPMLWYALVNAGLAAFIMGIYFRRRLGGYSGDCLGATQQVTEVVVYLSLLGSWNSL